VENGYQGVKMIVNNLPFTIPDNGITVVPQDLSWINHAMPSHGTCVISNSTMFTEEKYNYFMQNGYEKEIKPKKIIQIPKLLQNLYEKTIK
jgi:hypothetical protein